LDSWKNKGKAFIIVDHTNADDKIQGGRNKRRVADMIIKVEAVSNTELSLEFEKKRYLPPNYPEKINLEFIYSENSAYFKLKDNINNENILNKEP
jgi:hypothetical protein